MEYLAFQNCMAYLLGSGLTMSALVMKYLPSTEWKMLSTFVLQQKDWNQLLIAGKNLFMINLDNPAGNCKCQLIVMVLPALKTVHELYFYNYLFCFNMTNKCENFWLEV